MQEAFQCVEAVVYMSDSPLQRRVVKTAFGEIYFPDWWASGLPVAEGIQKSSRPPLGLIPRFIRDEQRRDEVLAAMTRYAEANKTIPGEWAEELKEIVERLETRRKGV